MSVVRTKLARGPNPCDPTLRDAHIPVTEKEYLPLYGKQKIGQFYLRIIPFLCRGAMTYEYPHGFVGKTIQYHEETNTQTA